MGSLLSTGTGTGTGRTGTGAGAGTGTGTGQGHAWGHGLKEERIGIYTAEVQSGEAIERLSGACLFEYVTASWFSFLCSCVMIMF